MVARLFWIIALGCGIAPISLASSIGVYFDGAGTRSSSELAPFAMSSCFVVVRDLGGELSGYECSIEASDGLTVVSASMLPASSINVGSAPANWIVGVGDCLSEQSARVVIQLTVLLTKDAVNLRIALGASKPSSVMGDGPAYALCDDSLYAFDEVHAATINLRPESIGRVKNRYGQD